MRMCSKYKQYIIEKYKEYKKLFIVDSFLYSVCMMLVQGNVVFPHYILYIMTSVVFGIVMKEHIRILLIYRREYKKVR